MTNEQATILFNRYLEDTITPEEYIRLRQWLSDDRNEGILDELVSRSLMDLPERGMADIDLDSVYAALVKEEAAPVHRVHFLKTAWFRYAAVILLLLGTGAYFWLHQNRQQTLVSDSGHLPMEFPPGKEGAILTLADGSRVVLDSLGNGVIATQNGSRAVLRNGQLSYDFMERVAGEMMYNTMTTPKGRQFSVVLPDGTKVWLNAASSITFPTAFTGKERKVEVRGEAYFEVAKNVNMPFRVLTFKQEIAVLGTSFNVNAYENEENINTTLIEGSVAVAESSSLLQPSSSLKNPDQEGKKATAVILKPGQQAQLLVSQKTQQGIIVVNADIEKVMAWKNGLFNFQDASLEEVMRQLERWYDIEVVYEKGFPNKQFMGKMSRGVDLAELIKGLEGLEIRFRIEAGRKLVVLP